jgi:sugar/nucleoside kinase (ribokinase family)
VGGDEFGSTLRRNLSAEGISIERSQITAGESSGAYLVIVDDCGENTTVVVPGANGRLTLEDTEGAPAPEAPRWGNAVGASSATRERAQPSRPTCNVAEAFVRDRQQPE